MGGAFWELLIGFFFVPIFELVFGVAAGAVARKFTTGGMDEQFIK